MSATHTASTTRATHTMSAADMASAAHTANTIRTKRTEINGLNITWYHCGGARENARRDTRKGTGCPIVLAHGAGADSALLSWREVMVLLAARGFEVIAPDLPGYGASDRFDGVYSLSFYSDFIRAFIRKLGYSRVVLGGLSLGGGITLKAAIDEPQLMSALIPVDAWGLSNRLPWHRLTCWYTRSVLNRWLYPWTAKHRWMIRWSLEANLFGDRSKVTDELVDEVFAAMQVPDTGGPFRSFQLAEIAPTGLVTSLFDHMPQISLPTLLIHGSKDAAVPLKDAIEAQRRIAGSRLHVMEGCRHWPQKERPGEFVDAVVGFLEDVPRD